MLLESLIAATCILGTSPGCENATKAYYKHMHFDKMVEKIRKKNPMLESFFTITLSVGSIIHEKKIVLPTAKTNYGNIMSEVGAEKQFLLYRYDF